MKATDICTYLLVVVTSTFLKIVSLIVAACCISGVKWNVSVIKNKHIKCLIFFSKII